MANQLIKTMQEHLSDPDNLSRDKIQDLLQEALKTFSALKEKSLSSNPKDQEEAYKIAMSLKEAIQTQTEELMKKAEIDPAALKALSENPDLFTPDAWVELSSAKKELESFREQLHVSQALPKAPHNKAVKKKRDAWLLG